MKPVYLEFCGINSFSEKAQIDFNALLSGGVFGIFGDTGSGKSTILDSIHFALYGEIDRAPKSFNDCINYKSETASVTFEFELTIEGARKRYRVQRERKRKNSVTKAWLYELLDGKAMAIAEGARDVDDEIEKIIGLSFADFKTCIALPQGDFDALVKSTPAERVKLVARLFNLERYGERLSKTVNEKHAKAEEAVRLVQAKMGENEEGKDEWIAECERIIAEKKVELTQAEKALSQAEERERLALALQKEKREFDELSRKYMILQARLPEMENMRALLEKLPRARAVAEKADALVKTQTAKMQAQNALQVAKEDFERWTQKCAQAKELLERENFEERVVALSVVLQKVRDASEDIEAERQAKRALDDCIAKYSQLKNKYIEEDFEEKKTRLENEISALGEDDNLLDYLKRHYKKILLSETYGEIRADLRKLLEKYPQIQAEINALLEKYAPEGKGDISADTDIATVNLAFKETERKRKLLKAELEALENRRRVYEENEGKKKLLAEQGKILRENYQSATQKTAQLKELGSEEALQIQLRELKNKQAQAKLSLENAQERLSGAQTEREKQQSLLSLHEEREKELFLTLENSLKENDFSNAEEAVALVKSLGNAELATMQCKEFFDEYGSRKRQYESADKEKLSAYDERQTEEARYQKQIAKENQGAILQEIAKQNTRLERLLKLREKYRELQKELAQKTAYEKLCDELRLMLRGNRFLEFIACEYLQEICLSASQTLRSLTGGRYFLQYDKDFKVGDNLDGGNLRAVKTLSGGETFLVSLSLALSLSSAICLKSQRPIEFFFLDEGFGTLDEKLVETVMDVLGKLSKNFAVGLISHVEELKHRIDNKIVVTGATETHGSQLKTVTY